MSNPSILWAQDREKVFLTLEISKVQVGDLKSDSRKIAITGKESVNNTLEDFELVLDLYSDVNPDTVIHQVRENSIFMTLEKTSRQFWNRLTPTKQNNVKIDWQRWVDDEDEEDSEEEELLQNFNDFKKTLPSELLETDFTELLPNEEENLDGIDGEGEGESDDDSQKVEELHSDEETRSPSPSTFEDAPDRSVDSIDDGFLANGEESYTDNSGEKINSVENVDGGAELVLDELDVEKLDADLEADL